MAKQVYVTGVFCLTLAALLGGGVYYTGLHNGVASLSVEHATDEFNNELAQIREAEKIEDPLKRCLDYPNPHEFDWDPKIINALCQKSQWQMMGWKQIDDALNQQHPELIDQVFDSYLTKNYSEPGQRGFLTWTFWWMFQSSSKWADETTQRWVAADPKSAYALAARGIHYGQAAYDARGGKSLGKTSVENVAQMKEFVTKARADLEQSLKLNPRLIAAYHGLIRIARLSDDNDLLETWAKSALALDSADPWIYEDWIDAVEPQWGGSSIAMKRVAEMAAQHADVNPLLGTLRAEPLCNAANEYRCDECEKNGAKSLDLYKQAGGFGPSNCFLDGAGAAAVLAQDSRTAVRYYSQSVRFLRTANWLAYRAPVLRNIGQDEWALQDLKNALVMNPKNTTVLYSQGLAYTDMGRFGDAEKSYLAILDINPTHENAARALSVLYLSSLHAPEKARPLVDGLLERDPTLAHAWLLKAALSENDSAAYRIATENYLKFVDHNDPAQNSDVMIMQAKLAQLKLKSSSTR